LWTYGRTDTPEFQSIRSSSPGNELIKKKLHNPQNPEKVVYILCSVKSTTLQSHSAQAEHNDLKVTGVIQWHTEYWCKQRDSMANGSKVNIC